MNDWLPPVWVPPLEAKVPEPAQPIAPQQTEARPESQTRRAKVASSAAPSAPSLLALNEAITKQLWVVPVQAPDGTSGRPHWCRPRHVPGLSGRRLR